MEYITIDKIKHSGAIRIKDTITDKTIVYYFCSERQAIQEHRKTNNLRYKHLTKIYL